MSQTPEQEELAIPETPAWVLFPATARKAELYKYLFQTCVLPSQELSDNYTEIKGLMSSLLASKNTISVRLVKLESPQTSSVISPILNPTLAPPHGNDTSINPIPSISIHIIRLGHF
ncbi:Hypothetical predicted protein, partial [Pelobates cultripes]